MTIRRQLRRHGRAVILIACVMAAATASSLFILSQERLASPFASSYTVNAAFASVAGVAPGLGEPVNVSGVQVGQISGATLAGGAGVLHMKIDPAKLPRLYANAHATLIPTSPLKDMQVDLAPGGPPAPRLADGATIPIGQTTTPIDSDDMLAALDSDTRAWVATLISGLDTGTAGRTSDLNALLRALGPTTEQVRRISTLLAGRRVQLRRLVHNLGVLGSAAASKDREISTVVSAGNSVLAALASQDAALRSSVAQLPGTLGTLRRTLGDTTTFAQRLGPTLDALTPTARDLGPTLRDSRALFRGAGLLPIPQLRRFVEAVLPVANALPPASAALGRQVPALATSIQTIGRFANEAAYNAGPAHPGFLYSLAWFGHNLDSAFSTGDANGAVLRGLVLVSCNSLNANPALQPIVTVLLGGTGLCT